MSSSIEVMNLGLTSAGLLVLAYAAYWALDIRRALAVRLYRNQALGIGLVAVGFLLLNFSNAVFSYLYGNLPSTLALPFFFFACVMTFYWVDSSVFAARRADPRLRDPFHWKRLRILLWIPVIVIPLVVMSLVVSIQLATGTIPTAPSGGAAYVVPAFATVIAISGVVCLPIYALRARDMTLRAHLKWFGVFAIVLFLGLLPPSAFVLSSLTDAVVGIVSLVGGYCLYRSAKSLAPLNRVSQETGA